MPFATAGVSCFDPVAAPPAATSVQLVFDCVGSAKTRELAIQAARPGAVVVHVGLQESAGGVDVRKITLADAYIKWYSTQEYYDSGDWRGTWLLDGGGALMNQSIHTIDLLYYLAGEVASVCAYADLAIHKDIETEDNAVAIVKFTNGALGVIEGSTSCFSPTGHPAEVHICGGDGSIFMRDNSFTVWDFKKKKPGDKKIIRKFQAEPGEAGAGAADPSAIDFSGHQKNFEDAVRSLKRGEKPLIDGTEARKSIEIILAIYRSALTGGKPVQLPLKRTPVRRSFS